MIDQDVLRRFDALISEVPEAGCWLWLGSLSGGYGKFRVKREHWWAHRLSYVVHRGPIPEGFHLDHLCRTRCCVNPWHLEPVTSAENARRSPVIGRTSGSRAAARLRGARTHCPAGHPFDEHNTRLEKAAPGKQHRRCRTCARERLQEFYARRGGRS